MRTSVPIAAWATLSLGFLFVGCASQEVPRVDDRLVSAGHTIGISQDSLARGRAILMTDCARCHAPITPNSVSQAVWDEALPRMIDKAGLDEKDEADLRAFISAARLITPSLTHAAAK